jgi:hypothetical protein
MWSKRDMEKVDKTELEQLAQQLHRPVMSLKAFSQLSQQDLAWLNQQLRQTIENEDQKMNQRLYQIPFFLRWLFKPKS